MSSAEACDAVALLAGVAVVFELAGTACAHKEGAAAIGAVFFAADYAESRAFARERYYLVKQFLFR